MNTVATTPGLVYSQSQQYVSPYPSPYTVSLPMVVKFPTWRPVSTERAPSMKVFTDQEVEQVGAIYAALAIEDAALAEMGLDEYADLLDNDLVNIH
jgi:hypothetical protein